MELPQPEFGENLEKITEGHQQVQEARQADVKFVEDARDLARRNLDRLAEDREVLDRYGYEMPRAFVEMLGNSEVVYKALEMAAQALGPLMQNDGVLPPVQRREAVDAS